MNNEEDSLIEDLVIAGALEVAGIDDKSGELLYTMTNKMKDLIPELYEDHMDNINKEIMRLWEKGFVNVDMMLDDPLVTLTQKAYDTTEISKLTREEIWSLEEIKRMLGPKV